MGNIAIIQDRCVGCRSCEQACPSHCILMKSNVEGFLYPAIVEDACINCGKCIRVCPVENLSVHRNKPIAAWAIRNKNNDDIMRSASGGASDLAVQIILSQDGVAYGAAYDENLVVHHMEITDTKERIKIQSSKYVQSDVRDCYSKVRKQLDEKRKVLFTGTPCQIAGLYTFLGGDKPNLYTIDLICHGVPSPKFFKKYLEYQSKKMHENVLLYNFRSKTERGWGTQYRLEMRSKTKTKTKSLSLDCYGKHFMDGDCYRESCYICPYANMDRVGDMTIGDFWGIVKSHPDFFSPKGVSSVFINTEKGRQFFKQMNKQAFVQRVTIEEGMIKQGNLVKPSARPDNRDKFYLDVDEETFIGELKVGLQIKERMKCFLPSGVVRILKRYIK